MLTPIDIKKKALRQYKNFLRAVLRREQFFPLQIKGSKGKASTPLATLFPQLRRLLEGAKGKVGYGYTVTLKTVNTRHAGEISMPEDIFFANVEDYLKFIEKEAEFLQFRKAIRLTQRQVPALLEWMKAQPSEVIKHLPIWEALLKVLVFFQQHPQSQQYSRALDIEIPTTFIEDNLAIIETLAQAVLTPSNIQKSKSQGNILGIKRVENMLLLRPLSLAVFPALTFGLEPFSVPVSICNTLPVEAQHVFIVQDKMDFLRFPEMEHSLAIYGEVTALENLPDITWLRDKQLYFWGNIAAASFEQLAQLRQHFPNIQPFLMDKKTWEAYQHLAIKDKVFSKDIRLLRAEEYDLFLDLKEQKVKLEQKHVKQTYLRKVLKEVR